MATVGRGKYTYELVPDWEKLPEGWVLGTDGHRDGQARPGLPLQPG